MKIIDIFVKGMECTKKETVKGSQRLYRHSVSFNLKRVQRYDTKKKKKKLKTEAMLTYKMPKQKSQEHSQMSSVQNITI